MTTIVETDHMKDDIMHYIRERSNKFTWYVDIENAIYNQDERGFSNEVFQSALKSLVKEKKLILDKSPYGWSFSFE